MHPQRSALPFPYVSVCVTRGTLVANITRLRLFAANFSIPSDLCATLRIYMDHS